MKILHVVGKMHRGGIETLVMEIFRRIDKSKLEFHFLVFTEDEGDYDKEIVKLGGRIKYVTPRRENPFENYKQIDVLIKEEQYDCIHAHLSSLSYITPLIIGKRNHVNMLIAHSHNTSQGNGIIGNVLHMFNKIRISSCCTHLMACSTDAGYWMFGKKLWKKKGKVLKNGIEVNRFLFSPERRESMRCLLNISKEEIVIGFSGRFEEQKNPLFVVEIFKNLQKYIPNSYLLLLGDGSLKGSMIDYINKNKLVDKVIFTGVVPNVSDYLQAMDVFVFPSLFEGLGISVVEAQCADLPVFTSVNVPNEAKILDSFHQIELEKGADMWSKIIANYILETNYERHNVKIEVENKGYSIDSVAKEIERFYLKEKQNA